MSMRREIKEGKHTQWEEREGERSRENKRKRKRSGVLDFQNNKEDIKKYNIFTLKVAINKSFPCYSLEHK